MLLYENKYEKLFNIKTLQIKRSDHKDNYHYQGASYMVLLGLFKIIPDHFKGKMFIDYGSGKGRALFCAEYCGFNKLTGIELDASLVIDAAKNLTSYSLKRAESTFDFIAINALDYEIPTDASVFFFFNPFSEHIMQKVAENILSTYKKNKREVLVIYMNPQHKNVFYKMGFKEYDVFKCYFYTEAVLFTLTDR